MSQELGPLQKQLKQIAEGIVFKEKFERKVLLDQMTSITRNLTAQQLIDVIKTIDAEPALRFLSAAGVHGEANTFLFARLVQISREIK